MNIAIFILSFLASSILIILALISLWHDEIQFWPPPGRNSWQYRTFWTLFRIMMIGIMALAYLDFQPAADTDFWWRFYIGGTLTSVGFIAAFLATHNLGWRNAHGEKQGLQTDGWYRRSRNPVYVVTIIGIIGLGLVVNSGKVMLILVLWMLLYLIAPFLEERWLIKQYGDAYRAYMKQVPRFL
ncbi:methyltransferase family protein [Candidatus Leptofilum sp.]|uniref:methyltransferase family protein n=1 Tax=Candidatus Leptofilum sp. TaxID=3241576 RepID=UPI003B5C79B4